MGEPGAIWGRGFLALDIRQGPRWTQGSTKYVMQRIAAGADISLK